MTEYSGEVDESWSRPPARGLRVESLHGRREAANTSIDDSLRASAHGGGCSLPITRADLETPDVDGADKFSASPGCCCRLCVQLTQGMWDTERLRSKSIHTTQLRRRWLECRERGGDSQEGNQAP